MASYRVGFCMTPGKMWKLGLPKSAEAACKKHNIELVAIDPGKPFKDQGYFDIIVHKALDFKEHDHGNGTTFYQHAVEHFESGLTPVILYPLEETLQLADRERMLNFAKKCEFTMNGITVFVPKFVSLRHKIDQITFQKEVDKAGLKYPLIVKQQLAAGSKDAHTMSLVFDKDHLLEHPTPCLVQEFINHGGIMCKIFLIGERVYIVERPSVRNYEAGDKESETFFSLDVSKTHKASRFHSVPVATTEFRTSLNATLLDGEVVTEIINRILGTTFESRLLGIDVLIEEETGNYGVVDINYFPGYDGILPQFVDDLTEVLSNECAKLKKNGANGTCNGNDE